MKSEIYVFDARAHVSDSRARDAPGIAAHAMVFLISSSAESISPRTVSVSASAFRRTRCTMRSHSAVKYSSTERDASGALITSTRQTVASPRATVSPSWSSYGTMQMQTRTYAHGHATTKSKINADACQ